MKKKYQKPTMKVEKIQHVQIICNSPIGTGEPNRPAAAPRRPLFLDDCEDIGE